jgi:hypothetical protein
MSRTGRPKNSVPSVRWTVYVPLTIAAEVELILLDPTREKIKYAARNDLIEELLRDWLNKRRKGQPQIEPETPADLQRQIQHHMGEANRLTLKLMGGEGGKLQIPHTEG